MPYADNSPLQTLRCDEEVCGVIKREGEENKTPYELDHLPEVHEFSHADSPL